MKNYKVKLTISGLPQKIIAVNGEPVVLQDIEYISLFVYRLPAIPFNGKTCVLQWPWRVSEEQTGMLIGCGATRQGAINHAKTVLNRYSKEKILNQIKKHKLEDI